MATTGTTLAATVRAILQDEGGTPRYSDANVLRFINEGQREAALIRPKISSSRSVFTLAPGTRQTIATGHAVLDVPRNYAADGVTPGRAIRAVSRADMDAFEPTWHSTTGDYVKHVMTSPGEPKVFYVWPAVSGGKVELIVATAPADLASLSSNINLDDIYATALTNYVLYRLYARETEEQAVNKATAYRALFDAALKEA